MLQLVQISVKPVHIPAKHAQLFQRIVPHAYKAIF